MDLVAFEAHELLALKQLAELRAGSSADREALELHFARRYTSDHCLAVYGTLAPGKPNHHQLSALDGVWHSGCVVKGSLQHLGWGADLGYPALRWSEDSDESVPVQLFVSADLPRHWARLDAFEGDEYLRILVPVHGPDGIVAVANVYAAR
jgi:gamma-glutamylcyclotransferase (GGCT)/AIG2-like uncharacterized protein YtfP